MRQRIEAIPTSFNGITYRSRAEAKWAWFFDKCRIHVQYEPEGFKTEAGWYLPDFQLMEAPRPTYFEVKPHRPTKREYDLMQALAKGAEAHVFVAHGPPSRNCFIQKVYSTRRFEPWYFAYDERFRVAYLTNAPYEDGLDLQIVECAAPKMTRYGPARRDLDEAGEVQFWTNPPARVRPSRALLESSLVRVKRRYLEGRGGE